MKIEPPTERAAEQPADPDSERVDAADAADAADAHLESETPSRRAPLLAGLDRWLVAITAGAVAWRWFLILQVKPTCTEASQACFRLWGDALYYYSQGELLAQGNGYVADQFIFDDEMTRLVASADHPPMYSTVLGIWSFLGLDGITTQRLLSAVVGSLAVLGLGLFATRLAGPRAGRITAVLAAVHPLLWINDIMLMSEAVYVPMVVAVLIVATAIDSDSGVRSVIWMGVVIALAGLARTEALVLFPAMVPLLIWFRCSGDVKRRIGLIALSGLAGAATVAPWVIYNNLRFSEPVTMTSSTGTVLMAGSCETAWSGNSRGYWANCMAERELWDDFEAAFPADVTGDDAPDKSVTDKWQQERALEWYQDHTRRIPGVVAARVGRSLDLYAIEHTLRINWQIEGRWRGPSTAGLIGYYLLHPPAILGMWWLRRRRVPILPMLSMWVAVLIPTAMTFGVTRYRVPIDVVLVAAGGLGIEFAVRAIRAAGDRL